MTAIFGVTEIITIENGNHMIFNFVMEIKWVTTLWNTLPKEDEHCWSKCRSTFSIWMASNPEKITFFLIVFQLYWKIDLHGMDSLVYSISCGNDKHSPQMDAADYFLNHFHCHSFYADLNFLPSLFLIWR